MGQPHKIQVLFKRKKVYNCLFFLFFLKKKKIDDDLFGFIIILEKEKDIQQWRRLCLIPEECNSILLVFSLLFEIMMDSKDS